MRRKPNQAADSAKFPWLIAAAFVLATCACRAGKGDDAGKSSAKPPATANPAPTTEGKTPPGDDEEDLVVATATPILLTGFIPDPAQIAIQIAPDPNEVFVTAPVGAIVPKMGETGSITAWIYSVPREELTADKTVLPGTLLGKVTVAADGSFSSSVPCDDRCFLVVVTSPIESLQIPVPASYPPGEITAAFRALAFDDPTAELSALLFANLVRKLFETFADARNAYCRLEFPQPCPLREMPAGEVKYDPAEGSAPLLERCEQTVQTIGRECRLPPGTKIPTAAYPANATEAELATFTLGAVPGCHIELPDVCRNHLSVPRSFMDVIGTKEGCEQRLATMASYCGFAVGSRLVAAFRAAVEAPAQTFQFEVTAKPPPVDDLIPSDETNCVNFSDFWAAGLATCLRPRPVRLCAGEPGVGSPRLGVARGDAVECTLRGFTRSPGAFRLVDATVPGTRTLRRYVAKHILNEYHTRSYETLGVDGTAADPSWVKDEILGAVFPDAAADPRLIPLYACADVTKPFDEAKLLTSSGCPDWLTTMPQTGPDARVLGYALP